jgi:hypothetical protein
MFVNQFRFFLLASLIIVCCTDLRAQRKNKALKNLGGFDERAYHFGVQLSINSANFYLDRRFDPLFEDSILSLQNVRQPGFNIAIIASLNINRNLSLRFIPGISPKERKLEYLVRLDDGRDLPYEKIVSSFYIDFPLLFKYRTNRINNFAAYVIAGGQYSRDMSSQEKVKNDLAGLEDQVVKIEKGDILLSAGGGMDFFLPYFKFGLELKVGYGLRNILIQDNTIFSTPLDGLRSRNFVISMTFEG